MKVSVAMCTYNGARFLQQQLDSLLAQSRRPDQVVICDDVSSDNTVQILQRFALKAQELGVDVKLRVNPSNLGYVRNFEAALELCDGELVFLCDQDDVWMPEKIERFFQRFSQDPQLLLLHADARLVDAQGQDLGCGLFESLEVTAAELAAVHAGDALTVLMRRNLVTGATAALRRELLQRALPVEQGWIHDEWLAMAAAASGGRVDCLEWPAIAYRQHGGNQIGAVKRSLKQKLAGAGPRRAYLAGFARRLDSLLRRCKAQGWMDAKLQHVLECHLAHVQARANLPRSLAPRLGVVWQQWRQGNYTRFGSGWRSITVDALGLS